MSWDGTERRNVSEDHDTLIEVVQILKNHVDNFDKHVQTFNMHTQSNNVMFEKIWNRIWKQNWILAIGVGILTTLEFFLRK